MWRKDNNWRLVSFQLLFLFFFVDYVFSIFCLQGLLGAFMGVGLGLFMGAMGDVSPIEVRQGREVPQAPLREQMRSGFKGVSKHDST